MLKKVIFLGIGFDDEDQILRITHGSNFRIYGGSEETHAQIRQGIAKLNLAIQQDGFLFTKPGCDRLGRQVVVKGLKRL